MANKTLARDGTLTTHFNAAVTGRFRNDQDGDNYEIYHREMMREGSAALLWATAQAYAEREGAQALQRFKIMQELAI